VLAVFAGMKWRMKLTVHYMTNKSLNFAIEDDTAYHILNERAEWCHKKVKTGASNTMKNIIQPQIQDNCCQHVMNREN
jgi:hypothetical protein